MRTAVRAELRERGIEALGMDSADDVDRTAISGQPPDFIVLEATSELLDDARIQNLIQRVPTLLIASRTLKVALPKDTSVLYRPVRIAEIISRVTDLLAQEHQT